MLPKYNSEKFRMVLTRPVFKLFTKITDSKRQWGPDDSAWFITKLISWHPNTQNARMHGVLPIVHLLRHQIGCVNGVLLRVTNLWGHWRAISCWYCGSTAPFRNWNCFFPKREKKYCSNLFKYTVYKYSGFITNSSMGRSHTLDGLCVTRRNHQICNLAWWRIFCFTHAFERTFFFGKGHGRKPLNLPGSTTWLVTPMLLAACDQMETCFRIDILWAPKFFQIQYGKTCNLFALTRALSEDKPTNLMDAQLQLISYTCEINVIFMQEKMTKPGISAHDPSKKKTTFMGCWSLAPGYSDKVAHRKNMKKWHSRTQVQANIDNANFSTKCVIYPSPCSELCWCMFPYRGLLCICQGYFWAKLCNFEENIRKLEACLNFSAQ